MLTEKGVRECFAQDLTPAEKSLVFAVQGATQGAILATPITKAAWHSKPSWFVIASNDRTIAPEQEISTAKRMGAKTLTRREQPLTHAVAAGKSCGFHHRSRRPRSNVSAAA